MAENIDEKNFDERLKNGLRKMVRSCDNCIKEAAKNFEQLDENLKHMEETDENFHKYERFSRVIVRVRVSTRVRVKVIYFLILIESFFGNFVLIIIVL